MSQFEQYGVADTWQLADDVVIPRGTCVAIKKLEHGPWVLRADILRTGDIEPRLILPDDLRKVLIAATDVAP